MQCDAGICVTASHNPAKYNGYKAYGSDGCQITSEMADGITAGDQALDIFAGVKTMDFEEGCQAGHDRIYRRRDRGCVPRTPCTRQSLIDDAGDLKLVYTPLNGAGKALRAAHSGAHRH